MIEKETAREATTMDIAPSRKHGDPAKAAFTLLVKNGSGRAAARGCVTVHDAGSGDATSVIFGRIPSGATDGRTVEIAGLPEVVIVHFEAEEGGSVWNGVLSGPDIPAPVIVNLT